MTPVCIANISTAVQLYAPAGLIYLERPGKRGCRMTFGRGITVQTMRFHVC